MLLLILKQDFSFCYYDGVFPSNSEKELLVRVFHFSFGITFLVSLSHGKFLSEACVFLMLFMT